MIILVAVAAAATRLLIWPGTVSGDERVVLLTTVPGLSPEALSAATEKSYAVPALNPLIVKGAAEAIELARDQLACPEGRY
jgi:hypothetical protein